MNVFPRILIERCKLVKEAKLRRKVPDGEAYKISDLIKSYNWSNQPHLLFCVTPYPNYEIAHDAIYEYCTNKELRKVFSWGTNKIMSTILTDTYLTVNVHIRIITGMLNKLDIPKSLNMYYHDNLVFNISSLLCEINSEDLPF